MTKVYFVRHAEPDLSDKTENRTLSEKGLADTKLVYDYLLSKNIQIFYSSPFPRSILTIKPLANYLHKEIIIDDELRERKIGTWVEDFEGFVEKQWNDFNYKILEGESLIEVQQRNIKALKNIIVNNKNKNICIGTHGTALSTIIAYYDNSFGHKDYSKIQKLIPWIVEITFNNKLEVVNINKVNVFEL